jgi:hypothetical protein
MPNWDIIRELRSKPTCSVPLAGRALGDLSRNPSYLAAQAGTLGVTILEIGGKKRVPSIEVLRLLGLDDDEAHAPVDEKVVPVRVAVRRQTIRGRRRQLSTAD